MGIGSHLLAVFEPRLSPTLIKRFARFHDETFEDTGYFSTPQAWHHERDELTALFIDYEYVDPDLSEAFIDEMKDLAERARASVTTLVDYDGDIFELADFEALRERDLLTDGLRPEGAQWAELSLSTGKVIEPEPEPDRAPLPVAEGRPPSLDLPEDERSAHAALSALREASAAQLEIGDLVFERASPDGPLNRLLIRRSSSRRELGPFLRVLRGFVKQVTVESTDDVAEARDLLDLSVRIAGQRNPLLDD